MLTKTILVGIGVSVLGHPLSVVKDFVTSLKHKAASYIFITPIILSDALMYIYIYM